VNFTFWLLDRLGCSEVLQLKHWPEARTLDRSRAAMEYIKVNEADAARLNGHHLLLVNVTTCANFDRYESSEHIRARAEAASRVARLHDPVWCESQRG
jgi:hypothetical protein